MDQATHFRLVEINENCIKYCLEETIDGHNTTAFWSVYKIRHRDEHRGYRFEWKITVRKLRNSRFDGKRNVDSNTNTRSFLIRDQDYPKYFESSVKKKEIKMEKRIFTTQYDKSEFPFSLDYPPNPTQFDRDVEGLNIGEYYGKGSMQAIRYNDRNPESTLTAENVNQLHHHYFLNKQETPIFKASHFEKVPGFPISGFNAIAFPNGIQPSQISIPRIHNQIDSYGQTLPTSSQAPFQFPDPVKVQESIQPTTYRGHYDDNRESILDGEEKRNNFEHNNKNQLISFPPRHMNVIPLSNINTTPSYAYDLHTSTSPSIQSLYNRHLLNPLQSPLHPNQLYWLNQNRNNPNLNFIASFPYHENTFSELDPVYHGSSGLATPSGIPASGIPDFTSEFYDTRAGLISQLPLQNVNDDNSYDASTEIHQTTSTNTDSSFTTPLNVVTTTRAENVQIDDEKNSYPDSINAQLPPPESGTDVRVPYVETDKSHRTQSTPRNNKKHGKTPPPVDDASVSVEKLHIEKFEEKTTKKPPRKYKSQRATTSTEKPSWTPKRPRLRSSDKYKTNSEIIRNSEKKSSYANRRKLTLRKVASTTTTIEPQTELLELDTATTLSHDFTNENDPITTTLSSNIQEAPRTSQSVQKSVSVHIAEKVTVIPRESTKVVLSTKNEDSNQTPRRIAKIRKVGKSDENSTEDYLEL